MVRDALFTCGATAGRLCLFLPVATPSFWLKSISCPRRGASPGVGLNAWQTEDFMGSLSIWHWLIVGAVVLLVFGGRNKISDMMGDVAKGIKAFKKGMADDDTPEPAKSDESMRTIDHQPSADIKRRAESESKI
jgi:sec-independent protein translocase protein TatA